jgi:dTDP-4-dehydrorhamnose 3,5-epimerase
VNIVKTKLDGVLIIEPKVFSDDRGYFFESYNESRAKEFGIDCDFVQENQSFSGYGTIRGLHFQKGEHAQAKLVRVIQGNVLDVAVDVRKNSSTFGQYVAVELSGENHRQLFIPRGFAHGFSVLSDTAIFSYKCDNFYHKESEGGIRYDDPELKIDWQIPADKVILSEKDLALEGLAACC